MDVAAQYHDPGLVEVTGFAGTPWYSGSSNFFASENEYT